GGGALAIRVEAGIREPGRRPHLQTRRGRRPRPASSFQGGEELNRVASFSLVAILSISLALAAGNPQQPRAPEVAAKLSVMEAALAADPDNLRRSEEHT